ncbi:MAG TPA: sulfatase-like hydrolase/transferase [Gemmatimonadales bacterium]|nr:sulfatase-like hydrolase/transferase [Gemmatimonadales bacterium]
MPAPTPERSAAREFLVALRLAALAWAVMAAQELLLFARPTPYGGAYVRDGVVYFGKALFYNLMGVLLVTLPFLARWLVAYRGGATARSARRWHTALLVLLVLTVGLDHADNEVMRFLGTHLTFSLLRTYERVSAWGSDMLHVFTTDRGGPWLPFILLLLGMGMTWWRGRRIIDADRHGTIIWPVRGALATAALPLTFTLVVYNLPGGHFPRNRVRPEIVTLGLELLSDARPAVAPADLDRVAAAWQGRWLAADGTGAWRFLGDPRYPLVRVPVTPSPDTLRPNVIFLQLETFRGWDMGFLRPDRAPSPTPFLDHLAADARTAWWSRFVSFGPPTINGFMAGHCSVLPHSSQSISTTYTGTALQCLPAVARAHGWHTAYFTGSDPDWDNQTIWLRRWYDEVTFYPDANELDRRVFHDALGRIRQLGRGPAPFFATVVSISNHYPFRSREPALDLGPARTPSEAILNTLHYTDDVVREFVDSLAREPWFGRTLLVIMGDHGYNLGEHDGTPGQRNGWRESVWVPFLIHGVHPRLPAGRHDEPASQLDLAPTVADLMGIRDTTPWLGRSLLAPDPGKAELGVARGDVLFAETREWSMVLDPGTAQAHLYDATHDPLQHDDVALRFPEAAARLERDIRGQQQLWDYLIESDRVWFRRPPPGAGR